MGKNDTAEILQENEDLMKKYPKGEDAVYKLKALDQILDSIGIYEVESRALETYRKMKDDDGQVSSVFEILRIAVLARGWDINYHGTNRDEGLKWVQFIEENFAQVNTSLEFRGGFVMALQAMLDAVWAGYSVQEVVWYYNEDRRQVWLKKLKPIMPELISFLTNEKGNLEGVYLPDFRTEGKTEDERRYGIKIPLDKCLIWTHKKEGSSFKGRSDFDPIYKYWYLKDFILKFWSIFTERYGAPFVFGLTKKKRMEKMRDALKHIITRTEFVGVTGEDELKILETAHDGNHFERFINYCDLQITKGMLVPTLLLGTGQGGGKLAGSTHFGIFEWRVHNLQAQLEENVNLLIRWMIDLNYKDIDVYPVFTFKALTELDRRMLAQTFDLLIKNYVVSPVEEWVRQEMKLPEADPEIIEDLRTAWEMKSMKGSSFSPNANIGGNQGDNRGGSLNIKELAEKIKKRPTHLKSSKPELLFKLVEVMDRDEKKLIKKLKPRIEKMKDDWIKEVKKHMKLSNNKEPMILQGNGEYPRWIDDLQPIQDPKLMVIFSDWYDLAMDDAVMDAEGVLQEIGMGPSWDVKTRVGRSKWIETNLKGLRSGSQNMAVYASGKIPLDMYNQVYPLLQNLYAEGVQPREIITQLRSRLDGHYSAAYLRNVARTNMTTMINSARLSLYRRRDDFVKGVEFQAIIDDRTTKICEEHDGKTFAINGADIDANTPPLHYMCRSILSPITTLDIPEGQTFEPTYNPATIEYEPQEGFGGVLTDIGGI